MQPTSAYTVAEDGRYIATELTRGPWDAHQQHAGPPVALVYRAVEQVARAHGLTHVARLTANLLRPVPIAELQIEVTADYAGRNAAHYSARLLSGGKEVGRFTALVQRESPVDLPQSLPGHPLPLAPLAPEASTPDDFPVAHRFGYTNLVEMRTARGQLMKGPCAIWFRMRHPLVEGEVPSVYQRVAVAADSGNGVSAVLEFARYVFVNSDLTINLLRRPRGEWICLDARTHLGADGCGLAESALFDVDGLVGRATQSLWVRAR